MALYDVMGKYLEVPAYKFMGQKLRDAVPVAAWSWGGPITEEFRDDIVRAVDQGYMIFKIHTNPLNDVLDWLRAAEEVAPPGFKIHLDFTGRRGRTMAAVLPLVAELERNHPIVGWIEDPFDVSDMEGWRNRAPARPFPSFTVVLPS
jgi:L-alanine-DL-glutamate epimerase-like enolase superfamily enzyme